MKTKYLSQIMLKFVLILGLLIFIFPFIFMISNSFERFTFSLPDPPRIIPRSFTLINYIEILTKEHIIRYFLNSTIITLSVTFLSIFISSLSAYGFSRMNFYGKEVLFKIYMFTLMIPAVLSIIPQFGIINAFHMIGTYQGLIILYVGTGICGNTFFLRSFFSSIPRELEESVIVDGGSHYTIFRRVVLPLSKPGIATLAILLFQGTWDDFFTAKVILGSNNKLLTLPVMIQKLYGEHSTKWGLIFAAALLMLIPIFALYIGAQKYFVVGGLTEGSVKG